MYYVFTNPDKEKRARDVVARNGVPQNSSLKVEDVAECVSYRRAKEANPKIEGEELVLEIYRGLGGRAEEFKSESDAKGRTEDLEKARKPRKGK